MGAELLASKVVILEEEPSIPTITALPSAVTLCLGITERGPIADPQLTTSFEEYQRIFGGFTLESDVAVAAYGFYRQGGTFMWVSRTCHFVDVTDPATATASKASVTLNNSGSLATPAVVGPGTGTAPFSMTNAQHVDVDVGAGTVAVPFTGAAASQNTGAVTEPYNLSGGETLDVLVNGTSQQVVFAPSDFAVPGAATALEVIYRINVDLDDANAAKHGAGPAFGVAINTDREGHDATIEITGGTANAVLQFPTAQVIGTGNVGNLKAVTALEVEAIVEAAVGLVGLVNVIVGLTGTIQMQTIATGALAEIQIEATSTVDFGLDHILHHGAAAVVQPTLLCEGKTPGEYANDIRIAIEAATNGLTASFNLKVIQSSVVKETWPNVNMDPTSLSYVETVVNDVNLGSRLITVDDLLLTPLPIKRPANGTSANMVGGDDGLTALADSDYVGNVAGPTGLYTFDRISTGRILIVPGVSTEAVHKGMLDYAEIDRNGSMFCFLDCPAAQTKTQIVTYVTSAGLLEYSEFGAIHWPRIKVANPQPSVYGTASNITVPPSGWIAGKCAANDQRLGGVYEAVAGYGDGWGVIRGMTGVEDDPQGLSEHQVIDMKTRDYVYPYRINPFNRTSGGLWYIDGSKTLKSTGNFPSIGERRGVIFIGQSLVEGLQVFRHRFNNHANRQ
ncbi:MAG: phage tail protein [Thermotogota bacterium]